MKIGVKMEPSVLTREILKFDFPVDACVWAAGLGIVLRRVDGTLERDFWSNTDKLIVINHLLSIEFMIPPDLPTALIKFYMQIFESAGYKITNMCSSYYPYGEMISFTATSIISFTATLIYE